MDVTVTPPTAGDHHWFVRRDGKAVGVVLYFPGPIIWRAQPYAAHRVVSHFETFDEAVGHVVKRRDTP